MVFRFSVCSFGETTRLFGPRGLWKALLQLKILHVMHADTRHSQAGLERNRAMRMTIDLLLSAAKLTCR
jgi:hypothetical protein